MTAQTQEAHALARLAFEELGMAAGGIAGMHKSIAGRAFAASGPGAIPVRIVHDMVLHGVQAALAGGARLAGHAAGAALSRRQIGAVSETRAGATALAIINGLRGDVLAAEADDLAIPMAVRVGGAAVPVSREALREAFPEATGRIAVFVHGLFGTEHEWALGGRETYGQRLRREHGWSPVHIRYNTGRAIDDNGAELSDLLERLVEAWPQEVDCVGLIGHSMGGLVVRSACHQAGDRRWKRLLKHSVTLGAPHTGSPVAQAVDLATKALGRLPETRMFGNFLDRRSAGIRDLQRGLAHPPVETARHHYVSAGFDLLVRRDSAIPAGADHVLHVPGAGHIALLNHPDVYAQVRDWLQEAPDA